MGGWVGEQTITVRHDFHVVGTKEFQEGFKKITTRKKTS